MKSYEVSYEVIGAGTGMVRERVEAASEFNARRIVEAKYGAGQTVRIYSVSKIG